MSFGSSTYGGSAYGGSANAVNEQIFFPFIGGNYAPDVLHEAEVRFSGSEARYSVFTEQGSESGSGPAGVTYDVYVSRSEGETPQHQVTVQGNGQTVVVAGIRIVVTMMIDSAVWPFGQNVKVTGRPLKE